MTFKMKELELWHEIKHVDNINQTLNVDYCVENETIKLFITSWDRVTDEIYKMELNRKFDTIEEAEKILNSLQVFLECYEK
jgi:hypothetical protein